MTIPAILAAFMLIATFAMGGARATVGELQDYKTGFKLNGLSADTGDKLWWDLDICRYSMEHANVEIVYRSTTPSGVEGGFVFPDGTTYPGRYGGHVLPYSAVTHDLEVTSDVCPGNCGEDYGIWHGTASFTSEVSSLARKATNHGDIYIWWDNWDGYLGWSFNIQHR